MSVDGTWNITINSPMGAQQSTLNLKTEGGKLTGTQSAQGNTIDIFDGSVDGANVAWSSKVTTPMPMTLEFKGTVDGTAIKGNVKAGAFGSFPFSGARA